MLALYFAARTKETKCVQMLLGRGPTREELRVEISLATQKASVIKDGVAILNTSVSTGRKGFDTPAGEYVVTDKKRSHRSTLYHVADAVLHAFELPRFRPARGECSELSGFPWLHPPPRRRGAKALHRDPGRDGGDDQLIILTAIFAGGRGAGKDF